MGHRIAKHVIDNSTFMLEKSTYYLLDASGNQLALYEQVVNESTTDFNLAERNIYGSTRLGTLYNTPQVARTSYGSIGSRTYELTNHLGNVLAVISDIVYPVSSGGSTIDYYQVGINNATDYSPFGVQLDGRNLSGGIDDLGYRYGFNGMEKDDEIKGKGNSYDYGARLYDTRLGRWLTTDPQTRKQPSQSPYNALLNNPLIWTDPNGETEYETIVVKDERTGVSMRIYVTKSAKVMTDGEIHFTNVMEIPYQNYYDYSHVTYITVHEDGTVSKTKQTEILTKNGIKHSDYVGFDRIAGTEAKYGDTYLPSKYNYEVAGGFYMTGDGGEGTKYWSKNADYVGNIDLLLATFGVFKDGGKARGIPTKGNAVEILVGVGKHQKDVAKKILKTIETAQKDVNPKHDEPSAQYDNAPKTYSNVVIWEKPENTPGNIGASYLIATPEEKRTGDTLGASAPPKNIYPKK